VAARPGNCGRARASADRLEHQTSKSGSSNRLESAAVRCYTSPMGRAEAIAKLKAHETELKQLGVEHLYLFGSTARDEASTNSDVDLFSTTRKDRSASTS
jgi:hypothetical protein